MGSLGLDVGGERERSSIVDTWRSVDTVAGLWVRYRQLRAFFTALSCILVVFHVDLEGRLDPGDWCFAAPLWGHLLARGAAAQGRPVSVQPCKHDKSTVLR